MCVWWFKSSYARLAPLFFSVPNGLLTSASQARIAVAEGLTKGVADTILLVPSNGFHGLCIEFKQEETTFRAGKAVHSRTYQKPEQKEWQRLVEAQGYRYAVVRTFEEFKTLIRDYLGQNSDTREL